jgi:hypothetical protein
MADVASNKALWIYDTVSFSTKRQVEIQIKLKNSVTPKGWKG